MSTRKLYDAVVITGKYTDKSGAEKNRYLTIGAVFESDKGLSLKLESLPVVGFNGWINFYAPKEAGGGSAPNQPKSSPAPAGDFDEFDDAPF